MLHLRRSKLLLLVPLLVLMGCPKQTLRQAVADIAAGLASGEKAVQSLYASQAVSAGEARQIEAYIREATLLTDQLNLCADQPATALSCVNGLEAQLKSKQAQMLAGFKSPKAQANFQIAMALFDQGLLLLDTTLNDFKKKGAQ